MTIPGRYDAINAVVFLGGSRRLRGQLVASLGVAPQHRVLELGCGSGQVTEQLVATGAEVTAVDALPAMLARAAQRAPSATFIEGDIATVDLAGSFDRVVLSFVLHNFDSVGRRTVLARSAELLGEGGSIGILDWAAPRGELPARLWRRFLRWLEPSPAVAEILDGALDVDVGAAGLHAGSRRVVAFGRAQILVVTTGVASPLHSPPRGDSCS